MPTPGLLWSIFLMLRLENVRLKQVEKFRTEEQIRKNSQAEEQIQKLKGITVLIHCI